MLPTDAKARKAVPIATGVLDYFPRALAAIAEVSRVGNEQHNPGSPLHWDRSKSTDEADALIRHFLERGKLDADGLRHSAKMAWRALALLEKELEAEPVLAEYPWKTDAPVSRKPTIDEAISFFAGIPLRPSICRDCGADLSETGHFVTCLSQAAQRR